MVKKKIKKNYYWKGWEKNPEYERTIDRLKSKLPIMECSKQLVSIISKFYKKKMKVLDFGCAAGHYYYALRKLNKDINYTGLDATNFYIKYAKNFFKNNSNMYFDRQSLFNLNKKYYRKFDIVYCCNVLLHLPSLQVPIKNLIRASKKYCIIRTLVDTNTHISQLVFNDEFDKKNNPLNFAYQNTFSRNYLKKMILKNGDFKIKFIKDEFKPSKINREYKKFNKKFRDSITYSKNNLQISGNKVFKWEWILITK